MFNPVLLGRIVRQSEGERNFHVFYYFLAGSSPAMRARLLLDDHLEYHYMRGGTSNITRDQAIDIGKTSVLLEFTSPPKCSTLLAHPNSRLY